MALWRKRQTLDPPPKIPWDCMQIAEFMSISTAVPDKFSQTGDGGDLILFRDWTDDDKIQSMVICLSGFGADILRNHSVWLCDDTFKSTPGPFKQVKSNFLVFKVSIWIKNCSKNEYSVKGLHYPGKTWVCRGCRHAMCVFSPSQQGNGDISEDGLHHQWASGTLH